MLLVSVYELNAGERIWLSSRWDGWMEPKRLESSDDGGLSSLESGVTSTMRIAGLSLVPHQAPKTHWPY